MRNAFRLCLVLFLSSLFLSNLSAAAAEDEDEYEYEDDEAEAQDSEDQVIVLTEKNFDSVISSHKFVLVEFYAPWCGHCKALAPEYSKAAKTLSSYDEDVVLAKVDATEEKSLAEKFSIKGYPTLKWFVDGKPSEYTGGRDEKTIVSWIKKKTGPAAATVATADELAKAEKGENVVVLGFFNKFEGASYDAFISLAKEDDSVNFVQTNVPEVAKLYSLSKHGVAVKKSYSFEEEAVAASGGELATKAELKEFIMKKKMPLVIPFSQSNGDLIFDSGISEQLMYIGDSASLTGERFEPFKQVAKELAGKLVFVTVDTDGKDAGPVVEFFGVSPDSPKPLVMGFSVADGKGKKFKMPGEYGLESLRAFGASMVAGTATPEYKSEPVPEHNKDGEVTVVVGKSFEDIVYDEKRDVMLEIYAPWCGHCKQLDPIYRKLAKRFKKVDSVVIAKMDGTANEHPDVNIEGFPTILFYPAGSKEAVPMDGERTLAAMTKFIKKHAVVPYELPKKKKGEDADEGHDKTEL
uniref:Protein disulfide-isomerase n=1 Tax=Tetraselmis sp. GSL018 TaxID=582737 RepID=A0A061SM56_9CHLO